MGFWGELAQGKKLIITLNMKKRKLPKLVEHRFSGTFGGIIKDEGFLRYGVLKISYLP